MKAIGETPPALKFVYEDGDALLEKIEKLAKNIYGAGEVEVTLVWEPQWTPERMSEDAKLA